MYCGILPISMLIDGKKCKSVCKPFFSFYDPLLVFYDRQVENIPHGYESFHFIPLDVMGI